LYRDGSTVDLFCGGKHRVDGSGEKPIPGADLLSATIEYELRVGLALRLAVRNAVDEAYFNSADSQVPLAPGRSVSASVRWSARGPRAHPRSSGAP
jgi:outer membrane receptor protein involved in Fe transport